ncbi:MAG: formate dehydrogenase subunit gamma [Burkholderiales bacterium PBB6]|nr:MAG: formate dehydrogenase subunit gamma [Burkholderiales bacterium PBB6]
MSLPTPVTPPSSGLPELPALMATLLARHAQRPGALLPLLHDVQDALGYVPADSVPLIAEGLGLSRAEVHGVISYYHFFRSTPPGRQVVQVCRAEACQACGSEALMAQAERLLGCAPHSTRADGAVSLEPVYCLGLCASSPAIQINDRVHARVTPERLARLVSDMAVQP